MGKGVFVVVEGTDGSGKATQTKLLVDRLRSEGREVETISFPTYGKPAAADVEKYLAGGFGPVESIPAKEASVFYANNRLAEKPTIEGWLADGKVVVCDRFVASNMGHQGAKFATKEEREEFFRWEDAYEYGENALPRPDLNVILRLPAEVAMQRIKDRGEAIDKHENVVHLKKAEATYMEIAKLFGFPVVECIEGGTALTPKQIHESIYMLIQPAFHSHLTEKAENNKIITAK